VARLSGSSSAEGPSPERSTATEIVLAAYRGSSVAPAEPSSLASSSVKATIV
jgi:hypothetical protein